MAKTISDRLKEIDEEMANIELEKIQVHSRIQTAILQRDDDERRQENRRLVQLSVRWDALKAKRQTVAKEARDFENMRKRTEED